MSINPQLPDAIDDARLGSLHAVAEGVRAALTSPGTAILDPGDGALTRYDLYLYCEAAVSVIFECARASLQDSRLDEETAGVLSSSPDPARHLIEAAKDSVKGALTDAVAQNAVDDTHAAGLLWGALSLLEGACDYADGSGTADNPAFDQVAVGFEDDVRGLIRFLPLAVVQVLKPALGPDVTARAFLRATQVLSDDDHVVSEGALERARRIIHPALVEATATGDGATLQLLQATAEMASTWYPPKGADDTWQPPTEVAPNAFGVPTVK